MTDNLDRKVIHRLIQNVESLIAMETLKVNIPQVLTDQYTSELRLSILGDMAVELNNLDRGMTPEAKL